MSVNGRMKRCKDCGGRWKADPDNEEALVCEGGYDEAIGMRVACFNKTDFKKVDRLPFVSNTPSDAEMDAIKEANSAFDDNDLLEQVKVKAEMNDLSGIDLSTPQGKKDAAGKILAACRVLKVKLHEDEDEARIKVGTVLVQELQAGATDAQSILNKIVKNYGVEEVRGCDRGVRGAKASSSELRVASCLILFFMIKLTPPTRHFAHRSPPRLLPQLKSPPATPALCLRTVVSCSSLRS